MDVAPTNKSPSYVKLLIKASNQQYDDQIIESDLSWTVKRLKSHLALVYPSKPVSIAICNYTVYIKGRVYNVANSQLML